jgi:hypothetical protein
VVKKLQGHASESDVILMVCDETGMSWAEAGEYVKKVAHENRRSIQGRLNLILIPMGLGVLIGGLAFFVNGLERIYAMYLLATATDPNAANLAMGFDYRAFLVALTGLAMIVGGAYGLYQSFKSFWE